MQRLIKIGRPLISRLFLIAVMIISASLSITAMAEEGAYRLLVKMKNNEEKAFLLAEKPVISFTESECVIESEKLTGYFDMGEIRDITINKTTGLKEIGADMITLDYTDPNFAVVRGVPAGVTVTLHTVTGILLDSSDADEEGNARIDMSTVTPGTICIISVNSLKNFKISKK